MSAVGEPDAGRPGATRVITTLAAALLGAAGILIAVVLAGTPGMVIGSVLLAGVALIVVRARLGAPARERRPQRERPDPLLPYPTYRRIESVVDSGIRSARLYDRLLAPQLTRLAAGVLAERRGIDLQREPLAAREALGEDVWNLITPGPRSLPRSAHTDPADPADSRRRARDIALVLDRLESL